MSRHRARFAPPRLGDDVDEAEVLSFGVRCQDCGEWETECTCDQSGDSWDEDDVRPLDFSDRNRQ